MNAPPAGLRATRLVKNNRGDRPVNPSPENKARDLVFIQLLASVSFY